MDLAIIIVSWNVTKLLRECLDSVYSSLSESAAGGCELDCGIWVVDNNSSDGTTEMVKQYFPGVHLVTNRENRGFAAANNQGMELALQSRPKYLILQNPDTAVIGRSIETLVSFMDRTPKAGMAGARLVYGDGSFQHSAFRFPGLAQLGIDLYPVPARLHESRLNGRYPRTKCASGAAPFRIDHPLGALMTVRREAVEEVGMMDAEFHMYCEEIDWAMRITQAGWDIYCVPGAEFIHYGGQSTTQIRAESYLNLWKSRRRLYGKHYSPLQVRLAGILVRRAMQQRLKAAETKEIERVLQEIISLWS